MKLSFIESVPGHDGLLRRRHVGVAEDALEDGDASSDDDVIRNILHDARANRTGALYKFQKRKSSPLLKRKLLSPGNRQKTIS